MVDRCRMITLLHRQRLLPSYFVEALQTIAIHGRHLFRHGRKANSKRHPRRGQGAEDATLERGRRPGAIDSAPNAVGHAGVARAVGLG